jgi:hypothetical protein
VILAAGAAALPAGALVVPPPSLVGEQFLAGADATGEVSDFVIVNPDCAHGTFEFQASGPAVGPYPGMFIEHGTVTLGTPTPGNPDPLATFQATFTIAALDGTLVSGTKELLAIPLAAGVCEREDFFDNYLFVTTVSYTATIELPTGEMFQDSGTGAANGQSAHLFGFFALSAGAAPPEGTPIDRFEESFDTSNGVVPVGGTGHVTGGGWILGPSLTDRVSFGFEAKANPNGLHGTCSVIDHATKDHIRCLSVDHLVVVGTHAWFDGKAIFNKTATRYRIDVDDLGEPGTFDTFKIQLDTGYVAAGRLLGGNIQIHK